MRRDMEPDDWFMFSTVVFLVIAIWFLIIWSCAHLIAGLV